MKYYFGPYRTWIGPYQIVDALFFWHEKYPKDELAKRWDYVLHDKFAYWLASTWLSDFCEWYHNKFCKQKIKVRIDRHDHWNVDSTLTPIILPLLKSLKEHKQGSGYIDLEDVPEELRYTNTEEYDSQSTFDFYNDPDLTKQNIKCDVHTRYEWALNEMIWAFEQLDADDWEEQYWKRKPEIDFDKYPEDEGKELIPVRWKVQGECDWDGRAKHQARIDNGLRLFGKYFQTLWD
jgi:hypothetical protein